MPLDVTIRFSHPIGRDLHTDKNVDKLIVLTARVVREKGPLTLASGAQIWATNWFSYKKNDSGALFDPHLDYYRYLIVISLIT